MGRIYHVLIGLPIVVMALCCWAQVAQTGSPLSGSQVITLEVGPGGAWIGHASIFSLQLRSDTSINLIYDHWRLDGVTAYRQWDLSISREWAPTKWMPLSATLGTRWRPPLDDHIYSYGGSGPWVYGIIQLRY